MTHTMQVSFFFILLSASLFSCSGDGNGDSLLDDFTGQWDIRFNLSQDDCQIVEPGILGFTDFHDIFQEGDSVTLSASSGFDPEFSGSITGDHGFEVEQTLQGDLFGDGISCEVYQAFSYEGTGSDTASSMFVRRLSCADGYGCESRGLGEAKRR